MTLYVKSETVFSQSVHFPLQLGGEIAEWKSVGLLIRVFRTEGSNPSISVLVNDFLFFSNFSRALFIFNS